MVVLCPQLREAKQKYLEVLQPSSDKYEGLKSDDLQLIHANHNLRSVSMCRVHCIQ